MERRFFPKFCEVPVFVHQPTIQRIVELDKDGNQVVVVKDLNLMDDPLSVMSYVDFTITNLLKSGVEIKPIVKSPDLRLGVDDSVIDDFNNRLDAINSDLFNVEN